MEGVKREVQICDDSFSAIGACVEACRRLYIAIAVIDARGICVETNLNNVILIESGQLVRLADAILVQVAPNAQVSKHAVCGVDLAVIVSVQISECIKPVSGQLAIAL